MLDQYTVHDITNSVTNYLTTQFDNYKLSAVEVSDGNIITSMEYDEFLLSMLQLLDTLEDAEYLRLFSIESVYFTREELYIQANLVIQPIDIDQISLLNTGNISRTIIQTIMIKIATIFRRNNKISSFFRKYNTRKPVTFINNDLFRSRQEWIEIVTAEYILHSRQSNPLDIISEIGKMNERNTNNRPHIYELYGIAVEKYLEYKYSVPVFYPFGLVKLGSGSFGSVYKFGENVVIKKVTTISPVSQLITEQISAEYIRETSILQHIGDKCPYLIHGLAYNSSPLSRTIVMEYGGISLDTFMDTEENVSESTLINIMYQILLALEFMELNHIVHGDIKANNVTIKTDERGHIHVKLIDLGLSCVWNHFCEEYATKKLTTAPKDDIWYLGMMFYHFITGEKIYIRRNIHDNAIHAEDKVVYIDTKYDRIYSFIENKMIVNTNTRLYATNLLDDRLFNTIPDKLLHPKHETVILKYRSLDDDQLSDDINSVSDHVSDVFEYLSQWTMIYGTGLYFDAVRLSLTVFSISYRRVIDRYNEVNIRDLLLVCYVLAHNYFGHEILDLNNIDGIANLVTYQMDVLIAVDYNFIFYDNRDKEQYFSDLRLEWLLDGVSFMS